ELKFLVTVSILIIYSLINLVVLRLISGRSKSPELNDDRRSWRGILGMLLATEILGLLRVYFAHRLRAAGHEYLLWMLDLVAIALLAVSFLRVIWLHAEQILRLNRRRMATAN